MISRPSGEALELWNMLHDLVHFYRNEIGRGDYDDDELVAKIKSALKALVSTEVAGFNKK